jgi:flagellin
MRISHNLAAARASRHLLGTNTRITKSVERLSTGNRVNSASDDASGLVISEQLRAQASGLRQAARNAQDGISMLQTTEGALGQVNTILNRARDLSVSAANSGTNSIAARQASQAELGELLNELDRISAASTFGSVHLLDGSIGKTKAKATGTNSLPTLTFIDRQLGIDFDGPGVSTTMSVFMPGGTYSVPDVIAHVQEATRAQMRTNGSAIIRAAADSFTVTTTALPGGGYSNVMEAGGLPAGTTFRLWWSGTSQSNNGGGPV